MLTCGHGRGGRLGHGSETMQLTPRYGAPYMAKDKFYSLKIRINENNGECLHDHLSSLDVLYLGQNITMDEFFTCG